MALGVGYTCLFPPEDSAWGGGSGLGKIMGNNFTFSINPQFVCPFLLGGSRWTQAQERNMRAASRRHQCSVRRGCARQAQQTGPWPNALLSDKRSKYWEWARSKYLTGVTWSCYTIPRAPTSNSHFSLQWSEQTRVVYHLPAISNGFFF